MSAALTLDPARFFTTDPTQGALLDRNGDGVPDDLRVRLLLVGEPSIEEWCELIHLAARLGLETGALTLPVALTDRTAAPASARPLLFVAAGATEPTGNLTDWLVRGAAELRALWQHGFGDAAASPGVASAPSGATLDLAQLYDTAGLLRDDDGDLMPDRVALTFVFSRPPALAVGLACCDLAARLGMESAGLRFPLAVPFGAPLPPDTIPLSFAPPVPGLGRPAPGEALCVAMPDEHGRSALLITGDDASVALLLRDLAATWPYPRTWEAQGTTVADLLDGLAATLHGETAEGRAALLAADLAALDPATVTGELRLLAADAALQTAAASVIARCNLSLTVTVAPDDTLAFVDEWTDEWEGDRARRLLRDRVLPALDPAQPAALLVLISEPPAVRRALAEEWAALLPPGSTVRVLSAFKAGLSWLTEVVAPAWAARGDLARVELCYRPFVAPEGQKFLDLPIRWLQELYPGDELLAAALGLPTAAVELREDGTLAATYAAIAYDARGGVLDTQTFSPRSYARPYLNELPADGLVTVTTGAVIARQGDRVLCDETLPTDLDRFWDHYQGSVLPRVRDLIAAETNGAPSAAAQPFFAALDIDVWCSEPNESLDLRQELNSSAEALHEDLYFGTLDAIAALGVAAPMAGTLALAGGEALDAPGAIRPFVHVTPGAAPRSRIALRRRLRHLAELSPVAAPRRPLGPLPTGSRPALAVTWLASRPEIHGFARLGLTLAGYDERRVAALHHLAVQPAPHGESLVVEIALPGGAAPVTLALPVVTAYPPVVTDRDAGLPAAPIAPDQLPALLAPLAGQAIVRRVGRSYEGRAIDALDLVKPWGRGGLVAAQGEPLQADAAGDRAAPRQRTSLHPRGARTGPAQRDRCRVCRLARPGQHRHPAAGEPRWRSAARIDGDRAPDLEAPRRPLQRGRARVRPRPFRPRHALGRGPRAPAPLARVAARCRRR